MDYRFKSKNEKKINRLYLNFLGKNIEEYFYGFGVGKDFLKRI